MAEPRPASLTSHCGQNKLFRQSAPAPGQSLAALGSVRMEDRTGPPTGPGGVRMTKLWPRFPIWSSGPSLALPSLNLGFVNPLSFPSTRLTKINWDYPPHVSLSHVMQNLSWFLSCSHVPNNYFGKALLMQLHNPCGVWRLVRELGGARELMGRSLEEPGAWRSLEVLNWGLDPWIEICYLKVAHCPVSTTLNCDFVCKLCNLFVYTHVFLYDNMKMLACSVIT